MLRLRLKEGGGRNTETVAAGRSVGRGGGRKAPPKAGTPKVREVRVNDTSVGGTGGVRRDKGVQDTTTGKKAPTTSIPVMEDPHQTTWQTIKSKTEVDCIFQEHCL